MTYDTDQRLKSYLGADSSQKEQMCLALLKNDRRFTNVIPRQPYGGPDGGRDIEAIFQDRDKTFGAVGFVNNANDSMAQKRSIKRKFKSDLARALGVEQTLKVFIFCTNILFKAHDKELLILDAKKSGISTCEIWDREILRIVLDDPNGFCIRFQYLIFLYLKQNSLVFFSLRG